MINTSTNYFVVSERDKQYTSILSIVASNSLRHDAVTLHAVNVHTAVTVHPTVTIHPAVTVHFAVTIHTAVSIHTIVAV